MTKQEKELQALNNAVNSLNLTGFTVHVDQTKKGKYLLIDNEGTSLTGYWDYKALNHFIMGYGKAYNKFAATNTKGDTQKITDFSQLEIGKVYVVHAHQFDTVVEGQKFFVKNKARLISFDTMELTRPISYWQFSERGYNPINGEQLKKMLESNQMPQGVFVLWDHDLNTHSITEVE